MTAALKESETCTWIISTTCGGAPGWEIDPTSTMTDDDVYFHFLEYGSGDQGVVKDSLFT
jgi:hypothetical protein